MAKQVPRHVPGGGAGIQHDGIAIADQPRCGFADAVLDLRLGALPGREGKDLVAGAQGHRASVGALELPFSLQAIQVGADRDGRYAQILAQLGDGDIAGLLEFVQDEGETLLTV